MSCSRTQHGGSGETRTATPLSRVKNSTTELQMWLYNRRKAISVFFYQTSASGAVLSGYKLFV